MFRYILVLFDYNLLFLDQFIWVWSLLVLYDYFWFFLMFCVCFCLYLLVFMKILFVFTCKCIACRWIRFYNINWLSKWNVSREKKFDNKKKLRNNNLICWIYEMKLCSCMKSCIKSCIKKCEVAWSNLCRINKQQ